MILIPGCSRTAGRTDGAAIAFSELRKESQDIYNRIHSIAEDSAFVDQVRRSYPSLSLIREHRLE